jgi:hypothetical protein
METKKYSSHPRPVLTQAKNNTTLWIGHLHSDPTDHFAGQTFRCPSDGMLDNIQVYSSAVHLPGEMSLTLHEFDNETKQWGPSIGNSTLKLERGDDAKWIRFALHPVNLKKDATYGFRLNANNALVALGEAASDTSNPFTFGHEWNADSSDKEGHFYTYFSLAFKVELCA